MRRPRRGGSITSLRARLILLFVAIFGSTLVLFALFLYEAMVSNHESEFDVALYNYAIDIAQSVDFDLFGEPTISRDVLVQSQKIFPFALGDSFVQIRTLEGTPIARSRGLGKAILPLSPQEFKDLKSKQTQFKTTSAKDFGIPNRKNYRIVTHYIDRPGINDFILQVAAPMNLLEREKAGLITFFLFAIPIVLLIAAFGGYYLSRKALAPVNAIIRKTREITALQLSERVPVPKSNDEIHELALTLNDLLDRLQMSFISQEAFIADASHQLKTPLAILRGEIDLMRSKPRTPEEVASFFSSASQEVAYLSRMVEDLVTLARVDAGEACLAKNTLRLDEILLDLTARMDRLASEKETKITLNLSAAEAEQRPFEVQGDPDLVRSMIESLIENAIKYSPPGSTVILKVEDDSRQVRIMVEDQGPGIPAEALPKIFDRFYRSETNREKVSGSGLGLTIAKQIAELHKGSIVAQSLPEKGARFTVSLPKRTVDRLAQIKNL